MKDMDLKNNIKKSVLASWLIAIGVYGLLQTSNSIISILLFSFGLYSICVLQLNLFTGKCGYIEEISIIQLLIILVTNAFSSYILGLCFSLNKNIQIAAQEKILFWNNDSLILTCLKSFFCGVIMFIAVHIFNKHKQPYGIFLGVPLFLICGFYHSIANITILGCAQAFDIIKILIWITGNWIGSYFTYRLLKVQ